MIKEDAVSAISKLQLFVCVGLAVSAAWTDQAFGVLDASSFAAIRWLVAPNGRLTETGGISNDGDVLGQELPAWRADPNSHLHLEVPVRWMRDTGYVGEVVTGGLQHIQTEAPYPDGGVPGESFIGFHTESIREKNPLMSVDHTGFAYGSLVVNNWHSMRYDIKNDILIDLGPGMSSGGNSSGLVLQPYSNCCGAHGAGYYAKVSDVTQQGLTPKFEVFDWFPNFVNDVFPWDINEDNIIVGNAGSLFSDSRVPMKLLPTGNNTWGDPIEMESLPSVAGGLISASNNATSISEGDRPFAAGTSGSPQVHGIIWDVNAGTIVADFGALTNAYGISANGKYVIGTRGVFFPPSNDPVVWMSDDEWDSWTELDLNADILGVDKPPPGAEIWDSFISVHGVNDDGMIVGLGFLSELAGSEQGPAPAGSAVFLLDTKELGGAVLLGDVDDSGEVNNLDITPFIAALAAADEAAFLALIPTGNYNAADVDQSGEPNNLDITPFIAALTAASGSTVPEPACLALLAAGALVAIRRRRRA